MRENSSLRRPERNKPQTGHSRSPSAGTGHPLVASSQLPLAEDELRRRVIIERIEPEIDGGRFPVKRVVGEAVTVEADIFSDGHAELSCFLLYRKEDDQGWTEVRMSLLGDERWRAQFTVTDLCGYRYTLQAWRDSFRTWRRDLLKKIEAGQDVSLDVQAGGALIEEAAGRARGQQANWLRDAAERLVSPGDTSELTRLAADERLDSLMAEHADRRYATIHEPELAVSVDTPKALFSSWYEAFPRSWSLEPGKHGTVRECEETLLPYAAAMGFDILYFPPIHPIGRAYRKGKNNALTAAAGDPGSPWGIGSEEGGHKAVHPELGTLTDFRRFVARAKDHGMDVALDIAFQCSPDHPYVKEHPQWFRRRPDGTIQYAENPPKKYQDIYPFDFETEDWRALWQELKSIFVFWVKQGVRIFRVDNPHTKPFRFWEWLIGELKREYPDAILLSEGFTGRAQMHYLTKVGFTQSYTYFAWRTSKEELAEYFTELTQTEARDYFRPNAWPNTPDIMTDAVREGGRPARQARLVLAATLCASYGIYGPSYEVGETAPRTEPGSDEYQYSEKYEIKRWNIEQPDSLAGFITRVNKIRRANPALHNNRSLRFHAIDNEQLICYSKQSEDGENIIVVIVNLDPRRAQAGSAGLPLAEWELEDCCEARDLLTGKAQGLSGGGLAVRLDPEVMPAAILELRRCEGERRSAP